MNQSEILKIFQDSGALLQGHFLLSSGLHSGQYLQCARVLENPQVAEKLCRALAKRFKHLSINTVVAPALGGIFVGYELARALGARAIFTEREAGKMCLRRGFALSQQDKALVAEDVITTGGSTAEVIEITKSFGASVLGVGCLVDRSGGKVDFGVKLECLIKMDIPNFTSENCPLCKANLPLIKPGSRDPSLRSGSSIES